MAAPKTTTTTTKSTTSKTSKATKAATTAAQQNLKRLQQMQLSVIQNYLNSVGRLQTPAVGAQMRQVSKLFPDVSGPFYTNQQLAQQAGQAVKGVGQTQLKSLGDLFSQRQSQGAKAISGYTDTYLNRLGAMGPAIQGSNQMLTQQHSALTGSLADYARDSGARLSEALGQQLGAINAPAANQAELSGNVGRTGQMSSSEIAAAGMAGLSGAQDVGTSWQNWANALPSIGKLEGSRALGDFNAQLNSDFATQAQGITQNLPELALGLYQNLLSDQTNRRGYDIQRGQALASAYGDAQQRGLNTNIARAAVLQNAADLLGQQSGNWLQGLTGLIGSTGTSTTTQTTTEPTKPGDEPMTLAKYLGNAAGTIGTALFNDPQWQTQLGKRASWAVSHPWKARQRVMGQLRSAAKSSGFPFTEGQLHGFAKDILARYGVAWVTGPNQNRRPVQQSPDTATAAAQGGSPMSNILSGHPLQGSELWQYIQSALNPAGLLPWLGG